VNHGGAVSNWETGKNAPSREQYERLRRVMTLPPYDEAVRPFTISDTVPYTDTWDFSTVGTYPGKHPCEKPLPMLRHIIAASTRPGALVLDCFAGSGNTGIAARQLGRDFIGCDASPVWAVRGARRVADAALQAELPLGAA
jgi:adenine-specific DNA-methyltransferase